MRVGKGYLSDLVALQGRPDVLGKKIKRLSCILRLGERYARSRQVIADVEHYDMTNPFQSRERPEVLEHVPSR